MDHISQISRAEVRATAEGGCRVWSFNANELVVFIVNVAAMGHSISEFTDGARSHCFLLNKRECANVPYLARQLLVFCKPN